MAVHTREFQRRLRVLVLALAFAASATFTWERVGSVLDAREIWADASVLGVSRRIRNGLRRSQRAPAESFRVGFLGDSTAGAVPKNKAIPRQLERIVNELSTGRPPIKVVSLAHVGIGPVDYFLLADEIAAAGFDQVVLHFNPLSLSSAWPRDRSHLAGWVAPSRIPQVLRLPLHRYELTADRLLFYVGIVRAGAEGPWEASLVRGLRTHEAWERVEAEQPAFRNYRLRLLSFTRSRERRGGGSPGRYGALAQVRYSGGFVAGLDSHPLFDLVGGTVSALTRSGTAVLVYLIPINVEHFERIGLRRAGLSRSIGALRAVVESNGGQFLDLHDILPDSSFSDALGHYVSKGPVYPHETIAGRLAPYVVQLARQSLGQSRPADR